MKSKLVFINEGELRCEVQALPSEESLQWIMLPHRFNYRKDYVTDFDYGETYAYPHYKALLASIDVSLNGQEYYKTGFAFLYQAEAIIIEVSRTSGPTTGGTPVFLLGSGYVNSILLTCQYADKLSRAIFLTRNVVLCLSPAMLMDYKSHNFFPV